MRRFSTLWALAILMSSAPSLAIDKIDSSQKAIDVMEKKKIPVVIITTRVGMIADEKAAFEQLRQLEKKFQGKVYFAHVETKNELGPSPARVLIQVPVLDENSNVVQFGYSQGLRGDYHLGESGVKGLVDRALQEAINVPTLDFDRFPFVRHLRNLRDKTLDDMWVIEDHLALQKCRAEILSGVLEEEDNSSRGLAAKELKNLWARRTQVAKDLAQAEFDARRAFGRLPGKVQVKTSFERFLESETEIAGSYRLLESSLKGLDQQLAEKTAALEKIPSGEQNSLSGRIDKCLAAAKEENESHREYPLRYIVLEEKVETQSEKLLSPTKSSVERTLEMAPKGVQSGSAVPGKKPMK